MIATEDRFGPYQLLLWDLDRPEGNALLLQDTYVAGLTFSPDSRWAVATDWGRLRLWDLQSADRPLPFQTLVYDGAGNCLISPDGRWLVAAGEHGPIALWDLSQDHSTEPHMILRGHSERVNDFAFTPDSQWLVSGSRDTTACLWNLNDPNALGSRIVLHGHKVPLRTTVMGPRGHWLATLAVNNTVALWDLTADDPSDSSVFLDRRLEELRSIHFDQAGRWLTTAGRDALNSWSLDVDQTIQLPRRKAGRKLTLGERRQYGLVPPALTEASKLRTLAATRWTRKQFAQAAETYEESCQLAEAVCRQFPDVEVYRTEFAGICTELAWKLLTCPDEAVRDIARAGDLLRKAQEQEHQSQLLQMALAMAH